MGLRNMPNHPCVEYKVIYSSNSFLAVLLNVSMRVAECTSFVLNQGQVIWNEGSSYLIVVG